MALTAPPMVIRNTVSSFRIPDASSAFGGVMEGVETIRDSFENVSYANEDGTANWKRPWEESDAGGAGPFAGYVQIAGGAAVFAFILTLPYALTFLDVRDREGLRRPPRMSERMAFQPGRDLTSHGYLYRGLLGSDGERMFPGVMAVCLGFLALRRRAPHAGLYAGAALLLLVVSLGPRLEILGVSVPLPYRALFALPPLDTMRHPYTFAAVATFLLAVLAGIGWATLPARPWAGAAVVIAAILETLSPPLAIRPVAPGLPPAYRRLETLPPGPILELPVFAEDTLLWAARHGRPVLNGVGAFVPRETQALETAINNHWLKGVPESIDDSKPTELLRETPLRYLIVPQGRVPRLSRLAAAIDASTTFRLVAEVEDGDRIYELRHPER